MVLLWVAIVIVAILLSPFAYQRLVHHRSLKAGFVEYALRHQKHMGYRHVTEESLKEKIEANDGLSRYEFPEWFEHRVPVRETECRGVQGFWMNEHEGSGYLIFYLAGGGFLHMPKKYHWMFLEDVALETGAEVFVPIYRRLPQCNCDDTYPLMVDIYKDIAESRPGSKIILSGDSSGGNIALVIAEYLIKEGYRQPDEIIVLSPATGYTYYDHEEEFAPYEKVCPSLSALGCNGLGIAWAGGHDMERWQVSPIYGDTKGMGRTTIFVGNREVFFPSCRAMHRVLQENGVDSELVVGRGLNHVYPIMPIPEAKKAKRKYCEIVMR